MFTIGSIDESGQAESNGDVTDDITCSDVRIFEISNRIK